MITVRWTLRVGDDVQPQTRKFIHPVSAAAQLRLIDITPGLDLDWWDADTLDESAATVRIRDHHTRTGDTPPFGVLKGDGPEVATTHTDGMRSDDLLEEVMTFAYGYAPSYQAVLYLFVKQKPGDLAAIYRGAMHATAGDSAARSRLDAVLAELAERIREPEAHAAITGQGPLLNVVGDDLPRMRLTDGRVGRLGHAVIVGDSRRSGVRWAAYGFGVSSRDTHPHVVTAVLDADATKAQVITAVETALSADPDYLAALAHPSRA